MDYKGQKLAEYIYSFIVILFGAIAWVVGYIQGDFVLTFYGWAIGLALSLLLCIPDWPMFNRNKVVWLEEVGRSNSTKTNKSKASQPGSAKKAKKAAEAKSS